MNHIKNNNGQYFKRCILEFLKKDQGVHMQMFGVTFLLSTVCIWQLEGCSALSLICFSCGVFSLYCSSVEAIRFRSKNLQLYTNTILIAVLATVFLMYFYVNNSIIKDVIGQRRKYIITLGMVILILSHFTQIYFTTRKRIISKTRKTEIIIVGILCFVFGFLLNIECFNTWPRWDSFNYYYAFEKLSARNIFLTGSDGLITCGHISISYGLWTLLFRSIPKITDINAMYLSNIVIVVIDVILLYSIFKWLLKDIFKAVLFTVIVICSPSILGFVAAFNAEIISTTGILLLLYAVFRENKMLSIFSVFIVCNARETGTLVAATIIFMQLMYDLTWYIKNKRQRIDWGYYSLCLCIGFFWLLQTKASNWKNGVSAERVTYTHTIDGAVYNRFGFSPVHIKDSLLGAFVAQFNWVFLILLILVFIFVFIQLIQKKKNIVQLFAKKEYWIIMAALSAYILELCAFVTYTFYRYYILSSVLLYILALCGICYIWEKSNRMKSLNYAACIIIGGLLLIQSYRSIDPVTALIYPVISTGKGAVFPINQNNNVTIEPYFMEQAYGNRQIMYYDKALDRVYAEIYDESEVENTKILCTDEYIGKVYDGEIIHSSLLSIWGFDVGMSSNMWGKWNDEKNYRYLSYEQENNVEPEYVGSNADINQYLEEYEHVYYIEMPWGDTVISTLQEKYPFIHYMQTVAYRGWILKIYRIK